MTNTHQRGIAIGPILCVVAILAVLASAIAAGSGAFTGDTSAVKAKAQASAILGYANEVKFAVDRLLANGCKDTEISFENPIVSGYENPNAPSDKSCHVFNVNGGGILFKEPPTDVDLTSVPQEIRKYFIHTHMEFIRIGKTVTYDFPLGQNIGRETAILLFGIKKELCLQINNLVNVAMESGDAPPNNHFEAIIYGYEYGSNGYLMPCGSQPVCSFIGCLKVSANATDARIPIGSYVFYSVLIVR